MKPKSFENENKIVTLTDQNGEDVQFRVIAHVPLIFDNYAIMRPVKAVPGMKSNEALVFKVTKKFGDDVYKIVMNDRIIDRVFKKYYTY